MKTNERFTWAVEILDLHPSNQLLEVGCGAGILVEQIAGKLNSGTVTAIDKSESMIRMASKRNAELIAEGKVKLLTGEFSKAAFKKNTFDKVLAFNVNFFWKNPERELDIISQSLKPNGQLYIFYQAPYDIDVGAAEPIKQKLKKFSYEIVDTFFKKMRPASAFCILCRPPGR